MNNVLRNECDEIAYKTRQIKHLMSILNLAIDHNSQGDDEIYLVDFSEMILKELENIVEDMDIFASKLWSVD